MEWQIAQKKIVGIKILCRLIFFILAGVLLFFAVRETYLNRELIHLYLRITIYLAVALFALLEIVYTFIFPALIFKIFKYRISEDRIEMIGGVIFINHDYIPMKRIQHVEIIRGPINQLFGIAELTIYTAGSVQKIIGLKKEVAEQLCEQIDSLLAKQLEAEVMNNAK